MHKPARKQGRYAQSWVMCTSPRVSKGDIEPCWSPVPHNREISKLEHIALAYARACAQRGLVHKIVSANFSQIHPFGYPCFLCLTREHRSKRPAQHLPMILTGTGRWI